MFGLLTRPNTLNIPEGSVLSESLRGWLDSLQAEALRKAGTRPVVEANRGTIRFGAWAPAAREKFASEYRAFELKETERPEQAGKSLVASVENNPALMYTLRAEAY